MRKITDWIKKWMFLWMLLLVGAGFLTFQAANHPDFPVPEEGESSDKASPEEGELFDGKSSEEQALYTEPLQEGELFQGDSRVPENALPGEPVTDASGSEQEGATAKEPVWCSVEEDYFEDVLFIGDSRTVGLFEYGGLEDKAVFYASTGLTVYKLFDAEIVKTEGKREKQTIEEALGQRQFGSIYLMVGINEMGTGTIESFIEAYRDAIEHLQELQPGAVIYIQSILKVTKERSNQGDYITNEGISARNDELAMLADNTRVFYLDINPVVCDESGGMIPEWTTDGVHLKAQYIPLWKDFLKTHVVQQPARD
ncbi:MAG: GDSL-type esterase/lipase family protein [Roseburia sp.]|nr:GDSL-type esterase/lipase family protein [Roseburia sp.]